MVAKNILCLLILIAGSSILLGQNPDRYLSDIFASASETIDIQFSTQVPQPIHQAHWADGSADGAQFNVNESNIELVDLKMDIFEPVNDDLSIKRPVILLCFGGGFVQGTRKYWSIRLLAENLAKMGFVTASIDYRIGMYLFDKEVGSRAVYRGVQDSRSAVRFFKANAITYNIDPDHIFIGGHSSGGFIALHNLYMDNEEYERPCPTYDWQQSMGDGDFDIDDQLCLDCVGDNQEYNGKATAAINLAGALGYLDLMENGNEPPPLLFHSQDDGTVPYGTGEPFGDNFLVSWLGDVPTVHGSSPIAGRSNDLGINDVFYSYTNRGHGVHEQDETNMILYSDIIPGISFWLYNEFLKPADGTFSGSITICENTLEQEYTFDQNEIQYFDWQITGGSFESMNTSFNTVTVTWDPEATEHKLGLIPFNENGASGNYQEIEIQLFEPGNNIWMGSGSGNWENPVNWSKGHTPLPCESVVFGDQINQVIIQIPENTEIELNGLHLGEKVQLNIPSTSLVTNNGI